MYSRQELDDFLEWCFFEQGRSGKSLANKVSRFDKDNVQGILAVGNDQNLYVVFRGTDSADDWPTDVNMFLGKLTLPYPDVMAPDSPIRVHTGFRDAWLLVRKKVLDELDILKQEHRDARMFFIGHSLGGALAKLASLDFQYTANDPEVDKQIVCVTFGDPRVGNRAFVTSRDKRVPESYHVANGDDPVFVQPWRIFGYVRGGKVIQLGTGHVWRWLLRRISMHYMSSYRDALREQ